jgi:predicted ATPase
MLIEEITLNGLLSFGPDSPPLPLRPLNVLVGPNGSGKSNIVEAIGFLRSSPRSFTEAIQGVGGGVAEWIWKGGNNRNAEIVATFHNDGSGFSLVHKINFFSNFGIIQLACESLTEKKNELENQDKKWDPFYWFQDGQGYLYEAENPQAGGLEPPHGLDTSNFNMNASILSQRKDPVRFPSMWQLEQKYQQIRIYRNWSFGRSSVFRVPQPADLPSDRLEENLSNFGLFLNHLRGFPQAKKTILEHLGDLYDDLEDFDVRIKGGTVEVFLTEGDFTIPASRLSDGTLRYLCLLAILCDPEPPPLICIEEPELGLHPDILPKIADLLIEASERTQLIVTTHSDILVDAMTEEPESVVVVEKHDRQTRMERLRDEGALGEMLGKYRLGELWMSGEIGGTRW